MEISLIQEGIQNWKGELLVIGLLEEDFGSQLASVENLLGYSIKNWLKDQGFKSKSGSSTSIDNPNGSPNKIVLVGLGDKKSLSIDKFRVAAATGAYAAIGRQGTIGIILPWEEFEIEQTTKAVCEAIKLSMFKDNRFKSDPEELKTPNHLDLIGINSLDNKIIKLINPICDGVNLARELVGAPPNSVTPIALAEKAIKIANNYGLEIKILDKKQCEDKGMGAYLCVAKGSVLEPKFIHLTYKSNGPIKHRIAMIGKGLTFDSGGYNLKVGAAQIDMMKFDMGGSAAVLGAARALSEIRPEGIEIHFIVAACENMINGSAVHPGDIVKASNGKSIEINNTDAEGRLTLADALVYASELEPDQIVDLATLTGACVIALGDEIAGLWTESDSLCKEIEKAALDSGEGIWRMPMHNNYKEGLKSMLADIKNTGPRGGGSITAALFLKEFVKESIQWAHIDIAGTVWAEKKRGLDPAGATGYGVRTLVNWVLNKTRE